VERLKVDVAVLPKRVAQLVRGAANEFLSNDNELVEGIQHLQKLVDLDQARQWSGKYEEQLLPRSPNDRNTALIEFNE